LIGRQTNSFHWAGELQEKESLLASTETELIKVKQAMGKESDDAKTKKKDAAELQDKYDTLAREKQELELKLASIQKLNTLLQSQQVETQEALEEAKARIVALEEEYVPYSQCQRYFTYLTRNAFVNFSSTLLKNPPLKRSSSSKNLRSELEGSLKAEIVPADVGRLQELEKAKLDLEVKCAVLESEKADLATQVDQLENYKKSAHQLSQTLESEKAELDKKLAELQAQLASASTNGAVVDEDALAALKTQLAALEAERSQLQAQINQLEQEKVDLASKLQVVGSEQSSHASRSQQLELEKAKLTSQLQQGLQEKEQLAAQLKRAEADNIQLASELEEARQQLHNNKELLEMSSSSSDLQQKTSVARLAALEQEKATLTASLREMEQQRSFIEAAKAQLTSRITQLEAELEKAESSRTIEAELRTEIAGLQKEKASLVERSQQLESQFAFAQQTITTLTDEKTRLADLNRQFETEGNDLQNRLQILQADLAAAKVRL
jgi:chromosome segregation ATPase